MWPSMSASSIDSSPPDIGIGMPSTVPSLPSSASSWSVGGAFRLLGAGRHVLARCGALRSLARQALAAPPPPSIEDPVVDLAIVAPSDEDRGTRGADRVALAEVDEGQGSRVVDGGAEVDREAGLPERPPEPDGLGEQPPPVDLAAARRADDRGIGSVAHGHQVRAARPPPRDSGASSRRGPGGCPPRT